MRHVMRVLLAVSFVLVVGSCPAQDQPSPSASEQLVAEATELLAACGYEVPAAVTLQERSARRVVADLDAQQDLFLPGLAFPVQHALMSRFGLDVGSDGDALRRVSVASMARGLSAYYHPPEKAFVLLSTATRDTVEMLAGSPLPLVVHELVHACQDARDDGLAAWYAAASPSLDASFARRIACEGEAEIAAVFALQGEVGLSRLSRRGGSGMLDSLLAGELTGLIYESGRRLALAAHDRGGLAAVRLRSITATNPAARSADTALAFGA
jgi:hypothetical protein